MQRIALIGGAGRIGRRYQAVLKYLNKDFVVYDPPCGYEASVLDCSPWIICAPTDMHSYYCRTALYHDIPFLCEKPLSRSISECINLAEVDKKRIGRVVCNYKFLGPAKNAFYDYYNTGPDGVYWDCYQLFGLYDEVTVFNTSPVWTLYLDDKPIPYRDIEFSYLTMLDEFTRRPDSDRLWNLEDGLRVTKIVQNLIEKNRKAKNESGLTYPGKIEQQPVVWKNI